jgi:hypothetical protein
MLARLESKSMEVKEIREVRNWTDTALIGPDNNSKYPRPSADLIIPPRDAAALAAATPHVWQRILSTVTLWPKRLEDGYIESAGTNASGIG